MMIFGSLVAAVAAATMGASMPADTVRGVVFDSLSQRPLAGASVMAEPGGQSAMTDDRGQFVLVAPEKITRVTAFHLALDKTGIGSISAAPTSGATRLMLTTDRKSTRLNSSH